MKKFYQKLYAAKSRWCSLFVFFLIVICVWGLKSMFFELGANIDISSNGMAISKTAELRSVKYSDEYNCDKDWPEIEIFLPLYLGNNTKGKEHLDEVNDIFLDSLSLFWPIKRSKVEVSIVVDEENMNSPYYTELVTRMGLRSKDFVKPIGIYSNSYPDHNIFANLGHVRQQLLMFEADLWTKSTAEFIAVVDSDCFFVTYCDREDFFENGKPVIIGRIGPPSDPDFWQNCPKSTYWLMGGGDFLEPMRFMSYFPSIIQRKDLIEMRAYWEKIHGKPWREVFEEYVALSKDVPQFKTRAMAFFNAVCTYVWYFKRDEYVWYARDTHPNDPLPTTVPGAVSDKSVFTDAMLQPKSGVGVHYSYHPNKFNKMIVEGYCRSPPFPKQNQYLEKYCSEHFSNIQINYDNYYQDLYAFEDMQYWKIHSPQGLILENEKRYKRFAHCDNIWDEELVERTVVKAIKDPNPKFNNV